jgi:hypothetical protein
MIPLHLYLSWYGLSVKNYEYNYDGGVVMYKFVICMLCTEAEVNIALTAHIFAASTLRPLLCKRFVSRGTRRQNAVRSVKQREPMDHFMHCRPFILPSRSERHAVVSYRTRRRKVA